MGNHRLIVLDPQAPSAIAQRTAKAALDRAPAEIECVTCDRRLAYVDRGARPRMIFGARQLILGDTDFCRWCGRAITAQGEAQVPTDGFKNLAGALCGEREVAMPTRRPSAVGSLA